MCTRTRSASRYANLRRDDVRAQPEAYIRGRLKMRDMKMRDQIAGVENAGKVSMESQSVKKCLKVVVFVCRIIPSV